MGIQRAADDADGVHQIAEALQGKILTLHRHQNGVRSAQGVQGQQLQGRGAVDKDEVVVLFHLVQRVLQQKFPALHADELNAGTGQSLVGGKHVAILGMYHGVPGGDVRDQHFINALGDGLVHAHAGCGIGLGVEVAQQHPFAPFRQGGGQIHAGGSFPNTALLVHDCNGFCHKGTYFPNSRCPNGIGSTE